MKYGVFPVEPFQAPKHTKIFLKGEFSPLTSKQAIKTDRSAAGGAESRAMAQRIYQSLKNIFSLKTIYFIFLSNKLYC